MDNINAKRPLPYIVVDQNVLRDEYEIDKLHQRCLEENLSILLPDAAILEMLKGSEWEDTVWRSLVLLAKKPNYLIVGKCTGELMREEIKTGEPCTDVVDHDVTKQFLRFLNEIRNGSSPTLSLLRRTVPDAVASQKSQLLDHKQNKATVLNLVRTWQEELSSEEIKILRSKDKDASAYNHTFRGLLAGPVMVKTCATALSGAGYPELTANLLSITQSVSSHLFLCMAGLALKWLGQGGLDSMPEEKVTNEVVDLEYIIFASLSKGIVSKERDVNEMYNHIVAIAESRLQLFKRAMDEND